MGWGWIPTVVSSIFGVFETAAVAGVGAVCPPLAPVVGLALSISGSVVNDAVAEAVDGIGKPPGGGSGNPAGFSDEQMKELTSQLGNIEDVVNQNRELLEQNQGYILKNTDYLKQNQKKLNEIKKFLNATTAETRKSMKEIKESLKTFDENMNRNFDELKGFIIEVGFIQHTREPIHILWDLMETACESQSKEANKLFLEGYKHRNLRFILAEFVSSLKQHNTNPISTAMSNNVLRSKEILGHYMQLLAHMVVKVIAVEGFHYGLTAKKEKKTKKDYADFMRHLSKDINSAIESIRDFIVTFKFPTEKYWPDLVNKTTASINVGSDTVEIADKLKKELDGIHTKDVFTIYAYRCPAGKTCLYTPLDGSKEQSKYLIAGGVNDATKVVAVVLRSETYRKVSKDDKLIVKTSYINNQATRNAYRKTECDEESKIVFGYQLKNVFNNEEKIYGFIACDVKGPIEERLTNNGTAIIAARKLLPKDKVYYGMSWV